MTYDHIAETGRRVLITGGAGFIGFWLARAIMKRGLPERTVIVDNLNDYYSPQLKLDRLARLGIDGREPYSASTEYKGLEFFRLDIADHEELMELCGRFRFTHVMNLAAQAGVRHSIEKPYEYLHSNLDGFLSLLEAMRHYPPERLVYASSSSVYGRNAKVPFAEEDRVDSPVSLYAATKKSNELMAEAYRNLYGLNAVGLRFFTVYGPWGRPDMAPMLFAREILGGGEINVFNHGDMKRDFTYVEDIVEGIVRVMFTENKENPDGPAPRVYNIGHGSPVDLMDFITTLEKALGKEVRKKMLPMQLGDVPVTWADTDMLTRDYGYQATTGLEEGLARFAEWLKEYRPF